MDDLCYHIPFTARSASVARADILHALCIEPSQAGPTHSVMYVGSSTETVAFQMYEILKIDHEFL